MAKTLRTRSSDGWTTKPAADIPSNWLSPEEVDDNFLAVQNGSKVGQTLLSLANLSMPNWLPLDGATYTDTQYPDLAAVYGLTSFTLPTKTAPNADFEWRIKASDS